MVPPPILLPTHADLDPVRLFRVGEGPQLGEGFLSLKRIRHEPNLHNFLSEVPALRSLLGEVWVFRRIQFQSLPDLHPRPVKTSPRVFLAKECKAGNVFYP